MVYAHLNTKLLVCVEGAIGVGKSTLLDNIDALNLPGVVVIKEPVEEWKAVEVEPGVGMLQGMYDGTVSSALFQLSILQSRFGPLIRALASPSTKIVLSERGPWSEKYVFAKSNLSTAEYACYDYAHASLTRELLPVVGPLSVAFLHLEMPIERVLERIAQRGRSEEASIKKEYMETLASGHEDLKRACTSARSLGSQSIVGGVHHVVVNADVTQDALKTDVRRVVAGLALRAAAPSNPTASGPTASAANPTVRV